MAMFNDFEHMEEEDLFQTSMYLEPRGASLEQVLAAEIEGSSTA